MGGHGQADCCFAGVRRTPRRLDSSQLLFWLSGGEKEHKSVLEVVNNGQDGFISNTIIKKESLKLVAFVSPVFILI